MCKGCACSTWLLEGPLVGIQVNNRDVVMFCSVECRDLWRQRHARK